MRPIHNYLTFHGTKLETFPFLQPKLVAMNTAGDVFGFVEGAGSGCRLGRWDVIRWAHGPSRMSRVMTQFGNRFVVSNII